MVVGAVIGVACLLAVAVFLGVIAKKQWKSFDEYLVGKRDIGPWVTGLALTGSYISGWAFCGSTAVVYAVGFSGMWFAGIWTLVGIIPTVWLAATKTRDFAQKLGAATITETIGRRFESKGLQTLIAVCMLFFLFMYSVGQLKAAGTVWYAVTGLPPVWCLLIAVIIAVAVPDPRRLYGHAMVHRRKGRLPRPRWRGSWVSGRLSTRAVSATSQLSLMAQKPNLMALIDPTLPKIGMTQLFSSWVGIMATPVIFFTMSVGFPHNVSRFLGMKKLNKKEFILLCFVVWLTAGIPVMLDCSSNGLVARMIFGTNLLANKQWGADFSAPMLAWAVGGSPLLSVYLTASGRSSPRHPFRDGFHHERKRDQGHNKAMGAEGFRQVDALPRLLPDSPFPFPAILFHPAERPPALLAVFMGLAAMGLGAIFFPVTVISYYWKRATKVGAILTVIYGTAATLFGSWAVLGRKPALARHGYNGMDTDRRLPHPLFRRQPHLEAAFRSADREAVPSAR